MFVDTKVLVIGILGMTFAIGVTAHATSSMLLWAITAAYLLIGAVRVAINIAFNRVEKGEAYTDKKARFWETTFSVGICFHALAAGLWILVACLTGNAVAQNASLAVTFGSLIGVCCRSYPFKRLVTIQVLLIFLPMWAGLSYLGGYHSLLGALLTLYMMSISNIAGSLRKVLLENIFQRKRAEADAQRFDSALNNLPHGVCVFDENNVMEVTNSLVAKTLHRSENDLIGLSVTGLISLLAREHDLKDADAAVLLQWANRGVTDELSHTMELGSEKRRTVKCRVRPTPTGGTMITIEDITKEVVAAREMEHMRKFDRLTGLYNRLYFTSQLEEKLKSQDDDRSAALIFVSLSRFKQINDALGHRFGDLLLIEAATRIKRICGKAGMVSRYGGNEFAIAVRGADASDFSDMIADTLISAIEEPFAVDGRVVYLGATVGISKIKDDKATASILTDQAGLALDAAKRRGAGVIVVYHDGMGKEAQNRRKLENDLRYALERGELESHFQPLVSVGESKVSTFEALMRWKHPVLGYVSPARFVPIAEEIGVIAELGAWMLEESCRICKTWPKGTRVAVNLSPLQFNEGNIVEIVRNALLQTGLEPSRLELEITESVMLENLDETIETLERFKRMGVRISLDDFGTGYSCLSYLNQLPLDKVKIDRSFVTGIEPDTKALTLVKAVSGLGHQLGLSVVIEGVETERELNVLLEYAQVDEIQGYLFSAPVPAEQALEMLHGQGPVTGKIERYLRPKISAVA